MARPDFVIAGAMRSGTTALAAALQRHPSVSISEPKEPNYFATMHGALTFRGPGDRWFASQNISDWESYSSLFRDSTAVVSGEASAMYLALPETARSIAGALPTARVILLLRDPLHRAMSAHSYLRIRGRETEPRFARALEFESGRRTDGYGPMWWYYGASDYAAALATYFEVFGRERVLVVLTELLKNDPVSVVRQVERFLGVDQAKEPATLLSEEQINSGGMPRNDTWTRLLYPPDEIRSTFKRILPRPVHGFVRRLRRSSTVPASRTAIPQEIQHRFTESARRTALLLDQDPSPWWQSLGATVDD